MAKKDAEYVHSKPLNREEFHKQWFGQFVGQQTTHTVTEPSSEMLNEILDIMNTPEDPKPRLHAFHVGSRAMNSLTNLPDLIEWGRRDNHHQLMLGYPVVEYDTIPVDLICGIDCTGEILFTIEVK